MHMLKIVMETSKEHIYFSSLHSTAGGMKPLCLETRARMLQQAFPSKATSSSLFPLPSLPSEDMKCTSPHFSPKPLEPQTGADCRFRH